MSSFNYRAPGMAIDREERDVSENGPMAMHASDRVAVGGDARSRSRREGVCDGVTVVIVHWNQSASCLRAIGAFLDSSAPVSVLVVDNGSRPEHLQALREGIDTIRRTVSSFDRPDVGTIGFDCVELLETGRNLGFGPGANAGLARLLADPGAGRWFAVAPHDVDPAEDCIELMLRAADEHPMAGLMCADVGDGMVPVIDPYFGGMTVPASDPVGTARVDGGRASWENVDYPHGTLLMASRECLAEIGLFDERYFSYCEEAELALRANRAGFEIGLVRGARVTNTHIGSGVTTVDYLQTRNTLLLVQENSGQYHAFIRVCIAILQILRGLRDESSRPLIFDARARVAGIRDFLLRRFGPPPPEMFRGGQRFRRLSRRSAPASIPGNCGS